MDFSFPSDKYKLVILSHYWLMGLPQSRIYRNFVCGSSSTSLFGADSKKLTSILK